MNNIPFDFSNMDFDTLQRISSLVIEGENSQFSSDSSSSYDTQDSDSDDSDSDRFQIRTGERYTHSDEKESDEDLGSLAIEPEEPLPGYGCKHYLRRCKIVAPCCKEAFSCRLCHDDVKDNVPTPIKERHTIDRFKVERVICTNCEKEQDVKKFCEDCGTLFGNYFCEICRLYDDVDKDQFHCEKCGVCRVLGSKSVHCDTCNICISEEGKDNHRCLDAKGTNCPVCMENLFDSVILTVSMKCGHRIHNRCLMDMLNANSYKCPLCSVSVVDLSEYNQLMDQEVAMNQMPEQYRDQKVKILCNECGEKSEADFHFIGHKCLKCGSYNTRQI